MIWITARGERMQIKDMTTSHIVNALAYVEEHGKEVRYSVDRLIRIGIIDKKDVKKPTYEFFTKPTRYINAFKLELRRRKNG